MVLYLSVASQSCVFSVHAVAVGLRDREGKRTATCLSLLFDNVLNPPYPPILSSVELTVHNVLQKHRASFSTSTDNE